MSFGLIWDSMIIFFLPLALHGLLIQMQNIQLAKFRHAQKAKFGDFGV